MGKICERGKKVLFMMLLLVVVSSSRASDTTYVYFFDLYSSQLDKTEMKTSILYDRVISFASLNKQQVLDIGDTMLNNYEKWKQIYLELYNADYNNSEKEHFDVLLNRIKNYIRNTSKIPIGIINYKYEYLDTNAVHNHSIELINNKLVRRKDIPHSPFVLDSVVSLSFLSSKIYIGVNNFVLDSTFVFSNQNTRIIEVELNFKDDIGKRKLQLGDTLSIIFTNTGDKELSYSIKFSNGFVYESSTTISIASSGLQPCEVVPRKTSALFKDYENHSGPAKVHWGFYYNNCINKNTSTLTKPIIILDGFDPGDTRSIPEIYDLMNGSFGNFADEMRALGHDIIVCNFDKGDDFIERNAIGLIELLEYVRYRTSDKIIVIGPSMGGLIARYALTKLEKENIDHQTCLYISIDAPHQGANIPMGDQFFLYFFGEEVGNAAALEGLNKIKSPAAREMLIDHYIPKINTPKWDGAREHFLSNISLNSCQGSNGYPMQLRKIALSNGSKNMIEQGVVGKLFSMEKYQKILFLGKVKIAEAQIYASPSRGTSQVAYVMAANPSNILSPLKKRKYASVIPNNPHPSSLDNSPGGSFNTQDQITSPYGYLEQGFQMMHKYHSFIPIVSSLDVRYPDNFTNYLHDIVSSDITCNNLTPFDAYFAPSGNESHVQLTSNSVNWLKYEINSAYQTVETTSKKNEIIGSEFFNYGVNTKEYYSRSFTVKDGGVLGVNMNMNTGYGNEAAPTQGSSFNVKGYNNCSSDLQINIENNGSFIIGDVNTNIGEFRVSDRTVLNLDQGAKLVVHNNSKLIIERGSKLVVGPNVEISLLGDQAQIIIEGDLVLLENSTFTFNGSGYISLKTNTIVWGIGSAIILEGLSNNDKVLEIANGKGLIQPFIKSKLKINNASVYLAGPDAYINSSSDIEWMNVQLRGGKGLLLNGQSNVNISNCIFNNNTVGITHYATNVEKYGVTGHGLKISNCSFYNNEIAIKLFGRGYKISNVNISNCIKGIVADGVDMPSEIVSTVFNARTNQLDFPWNTAAVNHIGTTGASLSINNSLINKFNTGIYANQSTLHLKCNEITLCNYIGVWAANNAYLNLSPSGISNSGNNTISVLNKLNNKTIFLEQVNTINISNGSNRLKLGSSTNNFFIAGTMKNLPTELHLQKNNWYTSLSSNSYLNNPSATNFIIQKNAAPSSDRVKIYHLLPILGSGTEVECLEENTTLADPCYDPGSCMEQSYADPLVYAPNADIISIDGYTTAPCNYVLKEIMNAIKKDEQNRSLAMHFRDLCKLYVLIKNVEFDDVKYLSDLTYSSLLDLYYKAQQHNYVSEAVISDWDNKLAQGLLLSVQDERINRMAKLKDSTALYYVLMDRAQTEAMDKHYEESLKYLREASSYVTNTTELLHNNYWLCTTELKEKIEKEDLSIEAIDSMLLMCSLQNTDPSISGRSGNRNLVELNENYNKDVFIRPNPSKDYFDVCVADDVYIHQLSIYDFQGRMIREEGVLSDSCYRFNNTELTSGFYYIQVLTNRGVMSDKIIINK